MIRLPIALLLVLAIAPMATASPPDDLDSLSYQPQPGHALPLAASFRDDSGQTVRLSQLFGRTPVVLALGYFHCSSLCGVVRADLIHALGQSGMTAGRDYTLVSLSIDPAETAADASAAKAADRARFPLPGAAAGWHYLTGSAADVASVARAVGFRDRFDAQSNQFLHPAGVVFVTAAGIVSGYVLGVGYRAMDVRLGVTRADRGSVTAPVLPILLLCYHYDERTGRYTLAVMKLVRLAAAITVLALGVTLWLAFRRPRGTQP